MMKIVAILALLGSLLCLTVALAEELKLSDSPLQLWRDSPSLTMPSNLVIGSGDATITFHHDGKLTVSPGVKPDEAAKMMLDALAPMWADMRRACPP